MKLIAYLIPGLSLLIRGKKLAALICLILQLSLIGWIPASLYAVGNLSNSKKSKSSRKTKSQKLKPEIRNVYNEKPQEQKENRIIKKEVNQNKPKPTPKKTVDYFYCGNCGYRSTNPMELVKNKCGTGKYRGQKHILYEGGVKDKYVCKYCGRKFPSIKAMATTKSCSSSDKFHEPML